MKDEPMAFDGHKRETVFAYAEYRRLFDLVNEISVLKATGQTPAVQARLAEAKAERDALQAAGVPVLSGEELARAKAARPVVQPEPAPAPKTRRSK
jgi:hypothetical protein